MRVGARLAAVDPARARLRRAALRGPASTTTFGFGSSPTDDGLGDRARASTGLIRARHATEAEARLERQITAVRTLFATRAEAELGWVDVRNPGKVYFRAKG